MPPFVKAGLAIHYSPRAGIAMRMEKSAPPGQDSRSPLSLRENGPCLETGKQRLEGRAAKVVRSLLD
ncbi:hypothetical protein CYFUS_001092 [Cystobacter fuscus]|uniref:Uncharacterized protein n=1 Tax=Cystobacter fuscus TaxID=43 RepID=A0A250IWL7_9BACT|nr:hypothetical protein CYFUS_001092 [Cystobacter fuscus]